MRPTDVILWLPCTFLWWIEAQPRPAVSRSRLQASHLTIYS